MEPKVGLIRRVKRGLLKALVLISSSEQGSSSSSVTARSSVKGERSRSSTEEKSCRKGLLVCFLVVRRGVTVAAGGEAVVEGASQKHVSGCEPLMAGLRRTRLNVGMHCCC